MFVQVHPEYIRIQPESVGGFGYRLFQGFQHLNRAGIFGGRGFEAGPGLRDSGLHAFSAFHAQLFRNMGAPGVRRGPTAPAYGTGRGFTAPAYGSRQRHLTRPPPRTVVLSVPPRTVVLSVPPRTVVSHACGKRGRSRLAGEEQLRRRRLRQERNASSGGCVCRRISFIGSVPWL